MQKLKKYSVLLFVLIICLIVYKEVVPSIITENDNYVAVASTIEEIYSIYNTENQLINTSQNCKVGDMFISADNVLYEVYQVDETNKKAYAKAKALIQLPKVNHVSSQFTQISGVDKKICMYHSHNDESYVIGDGYDSVYGKGGVMDIGAQFLTELNKLGITVYRSENLHLPHDTYAYSRSKTTAQSLIKQYAPHAIFDVHRDGVARSQYLSSVNGKTTSSIRMVIGKSNSNFATNLDFALAIKAYADKTYKGLIKDIYMGSGHYNQALLNTAILFEMGTYLIEKDYVISSLPYLADTIDKVMFTTAVEAPSGNESIGEIITKNNSQMQTPNNNASVNNTQSTTNSGTSDVLIAALILIGCVTVSFIASSIYKLGRKRK